MYEISKNNQFNSVEVKFDGKPSEEIRNALKGLRFRWHSVKKVWYGYATEEATRAAIDEAEKGKQEENFEVPGSSFIDGGGLYDGWQGGNYTKWRTEKELKELILKDFKRAGIAGTIRFNRAGYLTSLTVTLKITESDIKSFEDWSKDYHVTAGHWHYYTENGRIKDIYGENFYIMEEEEQKKMLENIKQTEYDLERAHLTNNNVCFSGEMEMLTETGNKKLSTAREIVSSYNRDCSNSMIDYFDRSIYDHYSFKIA